MLNPVIVARSICARVRAVENERERERELFLWVPACSASERRSLEITDVWLSMDDPADFRHAIAFRRGQMFRLKAGSRLVPKRVIN